MAAGVALGLFTPATSVLGVLVEVMLSLVSWLNRRAAAVNGTSSA